MYEIRPARSQDKAALASFTRNTFDWGDYIEQNFDDWLAGDDSQMMVATHADEAVAVVRAALLSPTEMWFQGARVHPEHRGHQLSNQLGETLLAWGRDMGAEVVRLYIEDDNEVPQRQVTQVGYRRVSRWLFAYRHIIDQDPQPTGNGGKRVPGDERMRPAPSVEAEPAYMAWSTSDMARHARSLYANRWTWRKLRVADLATGAPFGEFLEGASGWAMADRIESRLDVLWMMANPDDAYRLVRAILDRAIETNALELRFWVPTYDPFVAALTRIGCELEPGSIWERPLL